MKRNTPDQSIGPGWIRNRDIPGATGDGKKLDGSYVLNEIGPKLHQATLEFLRGAHKESNPFFLYFASPSNHTPHTPCGVIAGQKVTGASEFVNGEKTGLKRLDFVYENDVQLGLILDYLEKHEDPRNPGH